MARTTVNAKALRELARVLVATPAHQAPGAPATISEDVLRRLQVLIPSSTVVFHDDARLQQPGSASTDDVFHRELCIPLPDRAGHLRWIRLEPITGRDFDDIDRAVAVLVGPLLAEHLLTLDLLSQGLAPLTMRQRQLMALVSEGFSNAQAARTLGITEATVRTHLERIFDRLGVTSRSEAVARVRWSGGDAATTRGHRDAG